MRLHVNLDAAYLILPNTRRRGGEIFYLSDNPINTKTIPTPKNNGSILTECKTLKNVMTLVAKAEAGILYHNGQ